MLWTVAVPQQGITREIVPDSKVAYKRNVQAQTRRGAIEKCLPDINALLAAKCDKSIKYVSVYCGHKNSKVGSASRLQPVQIVRATGKLR